MTPINRPIAALDDKGRCCGRKPLVYKRDGHLFCPRCDRAFDLPTGVQIANWAYQFQPDGQFKKVRGEGASQ